MIQQIWRRVRGFVPVSLYPVLAGVYQWDRRRAIRRMETLDAEYRREHPSVVAPDAELRFNVVGAVDIPGFLEGGRRTADEIVVALEKGAGNIAQVRRGLDFGCGCGRLLQEVAKRWPSVKWHGSDVDERAIRWCQQNLPTVQTVVNPPLPPLPFADDEFDLIWCGSVFTHLDEARQDQWLAELRRVLSPTGRLIASVHGHWCWKDLPPSAVRQIGEKGFLFAVTSADKGIHPDWYQTAWHTQEYVERHWTEFVDVIAYLPRGFNNHQDVVVARKKPAGH